MQDQAYSLFYEVVLLYLENETKIVDHEDGEKIDEHPQEDLAKSGYKPDMKYKCLITLLYL